MAGVKRGGPCRVGKLIGDSMKQIHVTMVMTEGRVHQLTFLRPTNPSLASTELVADAHQDLAQAFPLPGRKDEDAREVVVIPAHLLLGEEADDLVRVLSYSP